MKDLRRNGHRVSLWWRLLALFAFVPVAAGAAVGDCPLENVVGQIMSIEGQADNVQLIRDGRRIAAADRMCLWYGDRLEIGRDSIVEIITVQGVSRHGQSESAAIWVAPPMEATDWRRWSELDSTYGRLFDPQKPPPVYGGTRGGRACRDEEILADASDDQAAVLAPLSIVPVASQRIGDDVAVIVAAWVTGNYRRPVTLQLARSDGRVVAQRDICGGSSGELQIVPRSLLAGDRLQLRIMRRGAATLVYPIEIVPAAAMPGPAGAANRGWPYGLWLLAFGPPDTKLAGLSWTATGIKTSFVALRAFTAVLTQQVLK